MKLKKILKITGIVLLSLIIVLAVTPFLFRGKIEKLVKEAANKNVNAQVDFDKLNISLLRNFPSASVSLKNTSIINKAPFEGDTLFFAEKVSVKMGLSQLFKGGDKPMEVKSFSVDNLLLNIVMDKDGNANYDIAKENGETEKKETTDEGSFTLNLKNYKITNSKINYFDEETQMLLSLSEFNHSGSGDLSSEKSELETLTESLISFDMGDTNYMNNHKIKLDADLGIDLKENKYSFLENEMLINKLPLVFDGFVKINEDNQEVDITFETPSSDFKNFLALIPEAYSKNIDNVATQGKFSLNGFAKGIIDDEHIPMLDIDIAAKDASFQYPDLPKAVKNIQLNTKIANTTGITNDTYIAIENLSFTIDEDKFNTSARIWNVIENPKVKTSMKGRLNLANLSSAYPIDLSEPISGLLDANMSAAFDSNSIENKQYENTQTNGSLTLSNFKYSSQELANPVEISKAGVTFNTQTVDLNTFDAQIGSSDIKASGKINNLLGFLLQDEKIVGNFDVSSNNFALNDFMVDDETEEETEETTAEKIKIPSFLDCTIKTDAKQVVYDNITLKNVKGTLKIKDEKAILNNLTSEVFDGRLGLTGEVSTKEETPTFDMNLDISSFDVGSSVKELELFKFLVPFANAISGKLNSKLSLSGNLKDNLTPKLISLSGSMGTELLNSSFSTKNSPLLQSLDQNIKFIDINSLDLKNLKTDLTFYKGKISLKKTLRLQHKDIAIQMSGHHGIDQSLNYKGKLDVPAKYLGKNATNLLAKLSEEEASEMTVPVTIFIGGNILKPNVKTNIKDAVANLTKQVAAKQKDKLKEKGKDLLEDVLGGNNKEKDSTKKENPVKNALDNLLKKKKKDN